MNVGARLLGLADEAALVIAARGDLIINDKDLSGVAAEALTNDGGGVGRRSELQDDGLGLAL